MMKIIHLIKFVLLCGLMTATHPAMGFLLSTRQCVVPAQCTCSLRGITCENAGLTEVPTFNVIKTTDQVYSFYIRLTGNSITSVSRNAFANISAIHPASIRIYLNNNTITSIDPDAFVGIESTTYINLDSNRLTSLPVALGKINNLKYLILSNNPLSHMDTAVLTHLGRSLLRFHVDMHNMVSWPSGFSRLQLLQSFQVDSTRFLPLDALDGHASSLKYLIITNSTIARIPVAICHLHNLTQFSISFMSDFDISNSLSEPCSQPLYYLRSMTIDGGFLHTFPNVLLSFPSIAYMELTNSRLHVIPSNVIPDVSPLRRLILTNNSLPRVPFALNKLTNLSSLTLAHNQISTVEDQDLIGLSSLDRLDLSNNPIEYIALHAFNNNTMLWSLILDNTRLHLVPEAVLSLSALQYFYFGGNNAECSCRLSYLKTWNLTGIYNMQGICKDQSHDSIRSYISKYLPQCP